MVHGINHDATMLGALQLVIPLVLFLVVIPIIGILVLENCDFFRNYLIKFNEWKNGNK